MSSRVRAYLIGGGIASLAAAVYLIRDGDLPGRNIRILSESPLGGSLDASGSAELGYSMRGSRMYGAAYVHTYDLLDSIPSLDDPGTTVAADTLEFWQTTPWSDQARLVSHGQVVDLSSWGFSDRDRADLVCLMIGAEGELGAKRIEECFEASFFASTFWLMWSSMFGFEPWHSAVELRRYLLRFLRLFPYLETMEIIQSTRYNGFDSIVRPIVGWLESRGVAMDTDVQVTDLDLVPAAGGKSVRRISGLRDGRPLEIDVGENDLTLATLGSMTAGASTGTMESAPLPAGEDIGGSWALWQRLAAKDPVFGRPSVFCDHVDQTRWTTFTVTDSGGAFARLMEELGSTKPGRGGLVTLTSSSWRLTFHLYHPPAYPSQPDGVFVWWGYGLFPDRAGDYVDKPMLACSGREILIETFSHLGFQAQLETLLSTSNCIPCLLPYCTSQFMPRRPGDRPAVVPAGTRNLGIIGQYCEMPDTVVYTVEYSVHSARLAVASLLGHAGEIPPTYRGLEHPHALVAALRRILA